jgi:hypothetical protein
VIAGQQLEGADHPMLSIPVRAVIALSPFADASMVGHGERFSSISGPVMNITGTQDVDAYGLVDSARLRMQPFQLMPPGDKYLVSLVLGTHGLIGGADPLPRAAESRDARPNARSDRGDEPTPQKQGRKRTSSPADRLPDTATEPDEAPAGEPADHGAGARSDLLTRQAISAASVSLVTTAFLDAYLRGDPSARSWLNDRARQWLTPNASLTIR